MSVNTTGFKQGLPPIPQDIAKITGPPYLGIILNWWLFGVLTLQYYLYYLNFPDDRWSLKLTVAFIFVMEFAQTLMTVADGFHWFVFGFGDVNALGEFFLANFDSPMMSSVVALVVQSMYAWRLYRLSKSKVLTYIIALCAVAQATGGIGIGIVHQQAGTIARWQSKYQPLLVVWAGFSALADVLIASAMTWLLLRSKSWKRGDERNNVLTKIVRLTIETNLASAAVALAELLTCTIPAIAPPKSSYFLAPGYVLGKLYSNSFLAMLNNRTYIRQDLLRKQSANTSFNGSGSRHQYTFTQPLQQSSVVALPHTSWIPNGENYPSPASQFPLIEIKKGGPHHDA
ncbi:hypothetical protein D9756_009830 [Leucocoprinus leucothites]|uniref:DUF6534 domain-containing protein n=1 Tax=Leucocoprinus leucothites TaxID=201217 RepID=A0A8H5CVT1_9AGAR|nr:hypothetical protein D9756_009830 [Leucoagaricus leucothites]